jgi:hypothetical protein
MFFLKTYEQTYVVYNSQLTIKCFPAFELIKQKLFMKALIMICALATSFMPGEKNELKPIIKQTTSYYWFNTSGTYLRQNTYATEFLLTGYTTNTDNPKTLQELGYAPANCSGSNPPVPNEPDWPDIRIYSHP